MGAEENATFVVDLKQPGVGDGVKYGINIPKEVLEKLWVDKDFPLNYTSLGIEKEKALSVRGRLLNHAWCPISYVHPDKPLFPKDGIIDPATLMQGALGDCWLITAISTMAEYPDSLKKLFLTKEHNEIGQYAVRLWCEGLQEWVNVKVDSFMPIDLGGGMAYEGKPLIYVNPTDEAVWMCILEKAFAKFWGNYMQLNGGLVSEGWKVMTGASDTDIDNWEFSEAGWGKMKTRFDIQNLDVDWDEKDKSMKSPDHEKGPLTPEGFFEVLQEWDSNKYLMCAGIIAKKNPNLKHVEEENEGEVGNGLVTKHAYGLLSSYEGHGFKLVRVRNPWGKKQEYSGDWGDASEKWKENPEVAKEVDFKPRVDGIFWMTIQDFCSNFTDVQVLKKSQPGTRAADAPYEAEREKKIKAARERANRIKQELYDNGGWYTDEAVSWRGGSKEPGMRVFETPELFQMVTKEYMALWGIPENNAKDFAEHARTKLPPKIERYLANRKKEQSKPKNPPEWMKVQQTQGDSEKSPAAGSGLGAVRMLQKEEKESTPAQPEEGILVGGMEAYKAKARAELEARQNAEPQVKPLSDVERAAIATDESLSQTDKWAAMGMF
mmetsp:Transcript_48497/g.113654  ORF Transcript_48497/g.113654 Transcript_48497/m.113654 type:complete len:604 (+) Transcript_48497:55-1866(+)